VTATLDRPLPVATPGADGRRLGFQPALEGLRGLAFVMVFLDHTRWLPNLAFGSVAMYVFFGLSGFLVTTQLLAQGGARGRIDLRRFVSRRARRLAPALGLFLGVWLVVVALCSQSAWTTSTPGGGSGGPIDLFVALKGAIGAAGLLTNWLDILGLYGGRFPLGHLWFIAVQEQVYVLWLPLLAVLLLRARRLVVPVALALGAASLAEALVFMHDGTNWFRVYAGTDTRAAAILFGSVAALWWADGRLDWLGRPIARAVGLVTAIAGLTWSLGALAARPASWTRSAGWTVATVAGPLLVVLLVLASRGTTTRALSSRLFVHLGSRSYALYLWHYMWLTWLASAGVVGVVGAAAASLGSAEVSWRLVEQPARRARRRSPLETRTG